jgi:hypothetical protein
MTHLLPEIAEQELGKKETSGNNLGAGVRKYQRSTNLAPGAWPWCAAFQCWLLEEWLKKTEVLAWLNLKRSKPESWRPRTALAYGFLKWAKDRPNTADIYSDSITPKPGDLVVYDFSHIGVVKQCAGSRFWAIEGNTNGEGSRDGDGVYLKLRPRSLARAFIRIKASRAS